MAETRGLTKVVVNADTDEILGAALLSYESHEVINEPGFNQIDGRVDIVDATS